MPGISNILDKLFIPEIAKLVGKYYYDINNIKNNLMNRNLFIKYKCIILDFRVTRTFCRNYKLEFSKKILLMVVDTRFGISLQYSNAYINEIDTPCLKKSHESIYITPNYDTCTNWNFKESTMICNSYIKANMMSKSPLITRIIFQCDKCNNIEKEMHTYDDKIDDYQIAEFCRKHR